MTTPPAPTPLPDEAFLASDPRPRRKRSVGFWLALVGGITGLLLFGGCLVLRLFIESEQATAPEAVVQMARQITDFTLPDGYEGEIAESVTTPLFTVRRTLFRHTTGKGVLSLVEMKFDIGDDQQTDAVIRQSLDQLVKEMRQITPAQESTRTLTIRGEPAEFHLRDGTDSLSSTRLREVRGSFRGKTGIAELWWQAEDSIADENAMEQLLDSLK